MATHVIKTHSVDAMKFTAEMGNAIAGTEDEPGVPLKVGEHEVTFEQGRGYRYNGQQVSFGDYLVTSGGVTIVMSAKTFHETYAAAK